MIEITLEVFPTVIINLRNGNVPAAEEGKNGYKEETNERRARTHGHRHKKGLFVIKIHPFPFFSWVYPLAQSPLIILGLSTMTFTQIYTPK